MCSCFGKQFAGLLLLVFDQCWVQHKPKQRFTSGRGKAQKLSTSTAAYIRSVDNPPDISKRWDCMIREQATVSLNVGVQGFCSALTADLLRLAPDLLGFACCGSILGGR